MFEPGWFKWILCNLGDLDDSLVQSVAALLLSGCISYEGRLSTSLWYVFGLCSFDFAVHESLQGKTGALSRGFDVLLRRAFHFLRVFVEIHTMCKRNEIFELRLHDAVRVVALLSYRVVPDIAFCVYGQRERISSRGLHSGREDWIS